MTKTIGRPINGYEPMTTVKIWTRTRAELKQASGLSGESMVEIMARLVEKELVRQRRRYQAKETKR